MKPTIGRVVHYYLTSEDAVRTNKRRMDFAQERQNSEYRDTGYMAHFGNTVSEGDVVPLVVTRVFNEHTINGQALLDGNDTLWVTSASEGAVPGNWSWPPRV